MFKHLIAASVAAIAFLPVAAQASTIAQWNFNDGDLIVDLGAGSATYAGGTALAGFNSGGGSSDPVQPGSGWSISTFAAQGTGDRQRGASFTVSTLGMENIVFRYDMRHSNTAPGHEVVQYSVDGSTFVDIGSFATNNNGANPPLWFNGRTVDLSAVPQADNQASVTFRVVAAFAPETSAYVASNTGASYGTGGTWRFDMVTVSGNVAPVPEPETYAMLLAGLALVAGAIRRRRA
ncbi:MAG: PEP-CTERM sorting domain-containing protein [Rhodoferax sp.]